MKTYMANPDKIERKWYVVDATDCTLGRLASEVAKVLRGKNKPEFTPHVDTGDYVIVVNAEKVKVTGKKLSQKVYYNHSDYVGGMKETTLAEMMDINRFLHLFLSSIRECLFGVNIYTSLPLALIAYLINEFIAPF